MEARRLLEVEGGKVGKGGVRVGAMDGKQEEETRDRTAMMIVFKTHRLRHRRYKARHPRSQILPWRR